MVEEPSHVKQLSLNHVCKIGLRSPGLDSANLCSLAESIPGPLKRLQILALIALHFGRFHQEDFYT
jgi:hypothetical protein